MFLYIACRVAIDTRRGDAGAGRLDKASEESAILFVLFWMPLHGEAEGGVWSFDGLDNAVFGAARDDKTRCNLMRERIREERLETYAAEMHLLPATVATSGRRKSGYSLGCALCQCGVPCEGAAPGG